MLAKTTTTIYHHNTSAIAHKTSVNYRNKYLVIERDTNRYTVIAHNGTRYIMGDGCTPKQAYKNACSNSRHNARRKSIEAPKGLEHYQTDTSMMVWKFGDSFHSIRQNYGSFSIYKSLSAYKCYFIVRESLFMAYGKTATEAYQKALVLRYRIYDLHPLIAEAVYKDHCPRYLFDKRHAAQTEVVAVEYKF